MGLHIFYENGELKKRSFVHVSNMKALPEATEYHMQQIMAKVLTKINVLTKVTSITLMQGTVDWKYAQRFSFTSASSYDVIHFCTTKLFTFQKIWQLLTSDLDMKQSSPQKFCAAASKRMNYNETIRMGVRIFHAWNNNENEAG